MGHEASAADAGESPPLGEWSDGVLANAVVLRQVDAFGELRRRHLASVAAVARMVLGNRASCEDVISEVFVGFWLEPQKFDPQRGTVLAYLRLTARGRSIDVVRSETARRRRELTKEVEPPDEDTDAAMIGAESASELRAAVSLLPTDERIPIELAFYHGKTYGAVALELRLPEGTVKSRIRRGLRRLELSEGLGAMRSEHSGPDDDNGEALAATDAAASVES